MPNNNTELEILNDVASVLDVKNHLIIQRFLKVFTDYLSLRVQHESLERECERLTKLNETKTQILSAVSHELRTPMSVILGFSELLISNKYSAKQNKKYLEEIYSASKKLAALIDDFLDLSRLESDEDIFLSDFEAVEISKIAKKAWLETSSLYKNHSMEWIISEDIPLIICDSVALERVLHNLFTNACKYSPIEETKPERKQITCQIQLLTAYSEENHFDEIMVSISDNGIGIAKDQVESVFQRFMRVDNSDTRKIGGTGLGLWISKQIIEAHGGKIWCESDLAVGTTFKFILPIYR